MKFERMVIEKESPEEFGYDRIKNMLTESSIPDQSLNDLGIDINLHEIPLSYTDHSGKPYLRELISREYAHVPIENIMITTGAVMAIFIVYATLLNPSDETLVLHPNYPANIDIPRSILAKETLYQLTFESNYEFDIVEFEKKIQPKTKLISITYPHNPTGKMISESTLKAIIEIVESKDCYLLMDETYRELVYGKKLPTAASLSSKAISIESMSKSYGMPGIRVGWLASQDSNLKENFLATKEQISICSSIIDEEIAAAVLNIKERILNKVRKENKEKFSILQDWIEDHPYIEWVKPSGGVICFPRIKPSINVDVNKYYNILNEKYGTFVGPGHWFEQSDRSFRIGYSFPDRENLEDGLESITKSIKESLI